MLLATVPLAIFGVVVVVVLIGISRARAAGRSTRPWGIAALVSLVAFMTYLVVATAVLRAGK